jgi:hypothetical protein
MTSFYLSVTKDRPNSANWIDVFQRSLLFSMYSTVHVQYCTVYKSDTLRSIIHSDMLLIEHLHDAIYNFRLGRYIYNAKRIVLIILIEFGPSSFAANILHFTKIYLFVFIYTCPCMISI